MVDEMKRKNLFIEYYLCTQQNFIKAKLIHFAWEEKYCAVQLWETPIYKLLSCFRKQHVLSRLFIIFFFFEGGREPTKRFKIIHFALHSTPCKHSYTCAIYYQFHK